MNQQETAYQSWIDKSESKRQTLTSHPMVSLAATLDKTLTEFKTGDAIPPLWHWMYFLETSRQSRLAVDGHAEKGEFLPPIDLPRRMWAGSRLEFLQPLRIGDLAERVSTIKDISLKQGRSGQLAFVCVQHVISNQRGIALSEEHDIVYRENAIAGSKAPPSQPAPGHADFEKIIAPDPILLFRYSALTFNGHRIHYDREFATQQEAYPGLVVHGPLLATLMVDLLLTSVPGAQLMQFEFKALRPVFDTNCFTVCCNAPDDKGVSSLWVQDAEAALCMNGTATVRVV